MTYLGLFTRKRAHRIEFKWGLRFTIRHYKMNLYNDYLNKYSLRETDVVDDEL